jgi:hypothetical protein
MAAIGAGIGLAKSELVDRPREERQRKQAGEIMKWSPWTGMAPNAVKEADPFGSALTTGLTGLMVGQATQNPQAAKDVAEVSAQPQGLQEFLIQQEQMPQQTMMNPYQRVAVSRYPFTGM